MEWFLMSVGRRSPSLPPALPARAVLYTCDMLMEDGRKPQEQVAALRQIAASQDWLVAHTYRDSTPGRGQRKRMLSRMAGSETSIIVAVGLPYLFASFSDFLDVMHEVALHGIRLVLVEDDLDTASRSGKKLLSSLGLFRQVEETFRATHARAGARAARVAGRPLGRPPKDPKRKAKAAALLGKGLGVTEVGRRLQMPASEVSRIKSQMANKAEAP